jgi:hypothetical protein
MSNQKSTAHVNLLLTFYNCTISIGCHSSYLIQFVGWFYFNLNNHSCKRCKNSHKHTSCKSLNTFFSRYLSGVYLGFLFPCCAKSNSFVLNHLSIWSFIGFHGMNIPFYVFILCVVLQQIPSNLSCAVPTGNKTICWMLGMTLFLISKISSKTLKLSSLLVNQKATLHTGCTMQSHPI